MPPSTVPYIGSKISLISNSEIRYEGILYTINTGESTIALQSVRCFGTEGRKTPEIPPSSEVYDFIIFRGQDIKDLTVLEACNAVSDPAIVSVNQRPAGKGPPGAKDALSAGKAAGKGRSQGGGSAAISGLFNSWAGKAGGSGGAIAAQPAQSAHSWASSGGVNGGAGNAFSSWGAPAQASKGRSGPRKGGGDDSYGGGWSSSYNAWDGGWGAAPAWSGGGWGGGKDYSWSADSYGKNGKGQKGWASESSKGKAQKGAKPDAGKGKASKSSGKSGGKGSEGGRTSKGKGEGKGSRRGAGGGAANSVPVGELVPEDNPEAKKEFAEDFDYGESNEKFSKVDGNGVEGLEDKLKPLQGYDKTKSFFDRISCEATERSGEESRPKIDREALRQADKETFGDTRRPPRPTGGRPGKGRRRGGAQWNFR